MLAAELANRQRGGMVAHGNVDDPFVFSPQMVQGLAWMSFACKVLTCMTSLHPAVATGQGGRPVSYPDASVLVTLLVMMVWPLSPETMVKRLRRWLQLAVACGPTWTGH